MLIELSDIATKQGKIIDKTYDLDFNTFMYGDKTYEIVSKEPVSLRISNAGNQKVEIEGKAYLKINIPCDRCLADVVTEFDLSFSKEIDMNDSENDRIDNLDEINYMIGSNLDGNQLIRNEIIVYWPMKVLCSNGCKGICKNCGTNLNHVECSCNKTELDPRMAAIWDVFNDNKEV